MPLVRAKRSFSIVRKYSLLSTFPISDSCKVNNGGCDSNAACSHDASTNAIVCTCKSGYTNVPTGGVVTCIQVTTTLAPGTQKAYLNS
ncbi:unnamed protein product, partial [Rotaria magnacalcarata]